LLDRTLLLLALLALLASGCYRTGLGLDPREDDDDTTDDDDFTGDFLIVEVVPDHGSAEGGTEVEIVVDTDISSSDPDDIIVLFGGELGEVLYRTETSIFVLTPPACDLGDATLDVNIIGAGEASDLYEYEAWAYGQDVAVLGIARSEFQSLGTGVTGAATAEFFAPTVAPPLANLPPLGSCVTNPVVSAAPRVNYSVGSGVTVTSSGSPFSMVLDPTDNSYSGDGLTTNQTPTNASYSLSGGTDPDGCSVDFPGIAQAAETLFVSDPPMNMGACDNGQFWCYFLDPDPSGVNPEGVTVSWTPGSGSIVLQLDRIDYFSDGLTGSVLCHLQDTGGVILSSPELSGIAEGLYQFNVIRYRTIPQAHPRSGGSVYGTYMDMQGGYGWIFQSIDGCYNNAC